MAVCAVRAGGALGAGQVYRVGVGQVPVIGEGQDPRGGEAGGKGDPVRAGSSGRPCRPLRPPDGHGGRVLQALVVGPGKDALGGQAGGKGSPVLAVRTVRAVRAGGALGAGRALQDPAGQSVLKFLGKRLRPGYRGVGGGGGCLHVLKQGFAGIRREHQIVLANETFRLGG